MWTICHDGDALSYFGRNKHVMVTTLPLNLPGRTSPALDVYLPNSLTYILKTKLVVIWKVVNSNSNRIGYYGNNYDFQDDNFCLQKISFGTINEVVSSQVDNKIILIIIRVVIKSFVNLAD